MYICVDPMQTPLLSVRELSVSVRRREGRSLCLDGISFDVPRTSRVALVGESGCGKSLAALSILRLLCAPEAAVDSGAVIFDGVDLLPLDERRMHSYRGRRIAMAFQEPASTLCPITTVGAVLSEIVRLRHGISRRAGSARAVEWLDRVGIASPAIFAGVHPHQLSSGMRQRVLLAMALACEPELLVLDEPTSLVDVGVEGQVFELVRRKSEEQAASVLLLTQSFAVALDLAEEVVVISRGQVVEQGPTSEVTASPLHPHTEALLGRAPAAQGPGTPAGPTACRFAGVCAYRRDRCLAEAPPLEQKAPGRSARCFYAGAWT
jgi:oligopeptide/dipeptide ABC transporter ATP-binding protein